MHPDWRGAAALVSIVPRPPVRKTKDVDFSGVIFPESVLPMALVKIRMKRMQSRDLAEQEVFRTAQMRAQSKVSIEAPRMGQMVDPLAPNRRKT